MHASRDQSWTGIYTFDEMDADLTLLPMAARRALDRAGLHLSLTAWQALGLADRRALIALGANPSVDVAEVHRLLASLAVRPQEPLADESPMAPPTALEQALEPTRPMAALRWALLHPLDRYVLVQLARRGRLARLAVAYDEILAAVSGD